MRTLANEWDPGPQSAIGTELGGRPVFLAGDYCGQVAVRDASEVAAGSLDGRPVVVAHPYTGDVMVWSVNDAEVTAKFPPVPSRGRVLSLATVDGTPSVVVPSGRDGAIHVWPLATR